MEFSNSQRRFSTKDQNKGKADKSKGSGPSSDNSGIDISRTLAKANYAKKPEVAPAEYSQDKAKQRDVASSSDVNKIGDIPENFKLIGGNTDLANAKVILLGEAHIPQHRKDILNFIQTHAKDGDIVLFDGWPANKKITSRDRKTMKQIFGDYENLLSLKKIKLCGCDDIEAVKAQTVQPIEGAIKTRELCKYFLNGGNDDEYVDSLLSRSTVQDNLMVKREEKMLEVINNKINSCHENKIFVIVGEAHLRELSIDPKDKSIIVSTIQENLASTKDLDSLTLKTLMSLGLKAYSPPEQEAVKPLIKEAFEGKPYLAIKPVYEVKDDDIKGYNSNLVESAKTIMDRMAMERITVARQRLNPSEQSNPQRILEIIASDNRYRLTQRDLANIHTISQQIAKASMSFHFPKT